MLDKRLDNHERQNCGNKSKLFGFKSKLNHCQQ
uniref:Uncharacterized protein n=1 Tax=Rhizophora mucronata TaxID=61149 RepID=A0A2P2Q733_RHIMU